MLVDDSRLALAATEKILENHGFQNLVPVRGAPEAFEYLGLSNSGSRRPGQGLDLIILDVDMPDMDGITRLPDNSRQRPLPGYPHHHAHRNGRFQHPEPLFRGRGHGLHREAGAGAGAFGQGQLGAQAGLGN